MIPHHSIFLPNARVSAVGAILLSVILAHSSLAAQMDDRYFTEDTEDWGKSSGVAGFEVSRDKQVGQYSLTAAIPFTNHLFFPGHKDAGWDLTQFDKLVFWAKADSPNNNLLVMLCTDWKNRRDAAPRLTTEWERFEIDLDEAGFNAHHVGEVSFSKVNFLCFYYNGNDPERITIWIDGLEFVKAEAEKKKESPKKK